MLQRIQTVYLLLALIANGAFFVFPVDDQARADAQQWIYILMSSAIGISMVLNLVSIFLFKNRLQQAKIVRFSQLTNVVGLGAAAGVVFSLGGFGSFMIEELIGTGLLALAVILEMMAKSRIVKDEQLVKSMDRLR